MPLFESSKMPSANRMAWRFASLRLRTAKPSGDVRTGAAVVEFALVLPIFLLLLSGIIEFGQAYRIEHLLSNACRRGARSAVLNGSSTNQIVNSIKTQCVSYLSVQSSDIDVTVLVNGMPTELSLAEKGDQIDVAVSVPYSKAAVGFFAKTLAQHTLTSNCVMEHE